MRILKYSVDFLIILIVLSAMFLAFHRTSQFENKLQLLSAGLWENHPEIMQESKTEDYFPSGCLKDMTVTAQIDKVLLSILASILVLLFIIHIFLESYNNRKIGPVTHCEEGSQNKS